MKKICIVGAGTAGIILALELNELTDHEIILLDCDNLNNSFNYNFDLKKYFYNNYQKSKTTGYGFGGSSNLWHGVLTNLDDEDFLYINKIANKNIKKDLEKYYSKLDKYYGNLNYINKKKYTPNEFNAYLDLSVFLEKKHIVQRSPTRLRQALKKKLSGNSFNLRLIENAIAIKLVKNDRNVIKDLLYYKNGKVKNIVADIFIISLGGLESPRLLLQSLENDTLLNKLIGKGLMDHPIALIGELTLKKYIFYKQIGLGNFLFNNTERIGYRIKVKNKFSKLNHSFFIRPGISKNIKKLHSVLKFLIYESFSFKFFFYIICNKNIFKLAFSLLSYKFGFGYFSKSFLVTMQLEQISNKHDRIELSKDKDKYMRRIPLIYQTISEELMQDINKVQKLFLNIVKNDSKFKKFNINRKCLMPGAHYSGTCRMGSGKSISVVDTNLRYHGIKNLYVCDASVIPKIGNANLVFTISAFSIRLAYYLRKFVKNNK